MPKITKEESDEIGRLMHSQDPTQTVGVITDYADRLHKIMLEEFPTDVDRKIAAFGYVSAITHACSEHPMHGENPEVAERARAHFAEVSAKLLADAAALVVGKRMFAAKDAVNGD